MQELKQALSLLKGVEAVGLGGSRGLGIADENSDYDFVLFRNGGEHIPAQPIVAAIKPFADSQDIFDGAGYVRARVSGKKIDIFQKNLGLVDKEISLAKSGKFRWSIRQLFPHGDISTCLISHVIYLEICSEKHQCLSNLRRLAQPFPLLLMDALIKTFKTQASITIIHASKIRRSADFQHLIALCSAYVFFANIVIFAINKCYPVLERGGTRLIASFPLCPKNYDQRIAAIFRFCVDGNFVAVLAELNAIQEELDSLANRSFEGLKTVSASVPETQAGR